MHPGKVTDVPFSSILRRAVKTVLTHEQGAHRLRTVLMAVSLALMLMAVVFLIVLPGARLLAKASSRLVPTDLRLAS